MESSRISPVAARPNVISKKTSDIIPGSVAASAIDTARAEINTALFMTAMMQPTLEGIEVVTAVVSKVSNAIKAVAKAPWSHWPF